MKHRWYWFRQNHRLGGSGENHPTTTARKSIKYSIFRGCLHETRLRIPNSIKVHMLTSYNFYIPPSARVCNEHMTAQDWNQLLNEDVSHDFTNDHILYIISVFRTALDKPSPVFNFELDTIDENELRHWTGLTIAVSYGARANTVTARAVE